MGTEWEERCVREFWTRDAALLQQFEKAKAACASEETPDATTALTNFVTWCRDLAAEYGRENIAVITDTAGYDVGWLDHCMPPSYSMSFLLGNYTPIRDVSSFHMGIAGATPHMALWGAEERARAKLNLPKPTLEHAHDHDPANDAYVIAAEAAQIARAIEKRERDDATQF
jgi:hypothetical protein